MFTKNFMTLMCSRMFGLRSNTNTSYGPIDKVTLADGSQHDQFIEGSTLINYINELTQIGVLNTEETEKINMGSSNYSAAISCKVGTGDTLPTVNDYKLDSVIPRTSLQVQNQNINIKMLVDNKIFSYTTIQQNITEENITVKEIGLYTRSYSYSSGGDSNAMVLIWREVLDEPIIIKPGKSKAITVNLDFKTING